MGITRNLSGHRNSFWARVPATGTPTSGTMGRPCPHFASQRDAAKVARGVPRMRGDPWKSRPNAPAPRQGCEEPGANSCSKPGNPPPLPRTPAGVRNQFSAAIPGVRGIPRPLATLPSSLRDAATCDHSWLKHFRPVGEVRFANPEEKPVISNPAQRGRDLLAKASFWG